MYVWSRNKITWSKTKLLRKKGINNKIREQPWPQLVCCTSIYYCIWLHILGNCYQEFRRGMVYRIIEVRIKHIRDINLRTKKLGYN